MNATELEYLLEAWETYEQGLQSRIASKQMWLRICKALGFAQEAAAKQADIDDLTAELVYVKQQKLEVIKSIVNQVDLFI